MNDKDIERKTMMDLKGLVFNPEQEEATRTMTRYYMTAADEAKQNGASEIEAMKIAMAMVTAMMGAAFHQGKDGEA